MFKKNVAKQDGAKILLVNFSQQAEEGGSADRVIEYTLHTVHTGRMAGKWRQNVYKLFFFSKFRCALNKFWNLSKLIKFHVRLKKSHSFDICTFFCQGLNLVRLGLREELGL